MWLRSSLAALALLCLLAAGCSRDLEVPPPPERGSLSGALDTGDHPVSRGNNEVRLINATTTERFTRTSDEDGGFVFSELTPDTYLIQADVPGFAPLREGPFEVPPGKRLDLGVFTLVWLGTSASEGTISGSVVVAGGTTASLDGGSPDGGADAGLPDGGTGRPSDALGATVTLWLERPVGDPVKITETAVDAFGRFSSRVPPGRYTIEATHPWYVAATRRNQDVREAQLVELSEPLVLQLNPATVAGTLLVENEGSATGTAPAAGAEVKSDTGLTATADVDGRFVLGGLAAGSRQLTISLPGYHDERSPRTLVLAAGQRATLDPITLAIDRGDLRGVVRMSDGSQLDDVSVFISGSADGGTGSYATQAVRLPNDATRGQFTLRGVRVGSYNVVARRTNYVDATSPTVTVRYAQVTSLVDELALARLQGDFLIEDSDPTNTAGFTRERNVTLVLSNVTNAAEYRVVEGSSQALQTASWQPYATPRIPFTLSTGDGAKTIYLQIKNTMGNEGAALSATIVLDTTPPANGSMVLASGAAFTRIPNPLPVTLNALDTGGVAFVRLAGVEADGGIDVVDAGAAFPQLVAPRTPYVRDTSFQRPTSADGVQGVVAQFIDNAGNVSDLVTASVVIDTVPPTGSLVVQRGAKATLDGYTNSLLVDLAETWGVEPNGGFVQVRLANDALDLSNAVAQPVRARASWFLDAQGEGTKTVHYVFVDAAGNQAGASQATIIYDATSPQVQATLLSPTPTPSPQLTIGLNAVATSPYAPDAGVAVSESALFTNAVQQSFPSNSQVSWTLSSGDGPRTVYVRVKDAAGNEGTSSVSLELDTTAPTGLAIGLVGALADGTPSSTLTAQATVTVNLTQSGATKVLFGDGNLTSCPAVTASGWVGITGNSIPNHPLPGSGSTRTVSACFADAAGNVAGPVTASIDLDSTPPTGCQLALSGLRTDGTPSTGARTALRSVPFSLNNCSDVPLEIALTEQTNVTCGATTAGLVWAPYSTVANQLTLSSVDGTKTVNGCVRDLARNTTSFTNASITLDTTPPTGARVTLNGGAAYLNASGLDAGVAVVSVAGTAVGATEWAIAEEGTTPSTFVDFATRNPLTLALSGGDGVKTVRALFRDDLGNTIPVEVGDSIEVDTTAPTLTSLALSGPLADGVSSTTLTTSPDVTATLVQIGATTVFFSNTALSSCPTSGHSALTGSTAQVTLSSPGTRTVSACVGDAAGNVSAVRTASITWDSAGPTGCALVLTGLRADDASPTSGAAAGRTGRREVRYTLSSCTETPAQIFLTDSTVSCTAANGFVWSLYDPLATNTYTLPGVDGLKTVRACVRDAARNTLSVVAASITLDTTPPTGTSVSIRGGAAWFNRADWLAATPASSNTMSVTGTATGAVDWALSETTTPSTFVAFTAPSSSTPFTFSTGDGTKAVRALFRDDVGNVTSAEVTDTIEVDTTPPTLTRLDITGSLADTTPSTVSTSTLGVTATLTHTGATKVAFGSSGTMNCATQTSWTTFSGTSVSTTLSGTPGIPATLTLAACVTDEAGNPAGPVTDTILYDNVAPASCTLVMSGRTASGGATTLDKSALRDVPFTFSGCAEAPADVFLTEAATVNCNGNLDWRPLTGGDTLTLSAVDGTKTVRGCVRDSTRNATTLALDTIVLDTTPPTGTSVSIRAGAAYFNRADWTSATPANTNTMSVTGTATGAVEWALSETTTPSTFVAFTAPSTSTPFTFSVGDGTKAVRALFRDDVGNVTAAEVTDTIEVDTGLPSLTSVQLAGTLADNTDSTLITASATVTAYINQAGATRVYFGDGTLTTCPTSGYVDFNGSSATTTLTGSGLTRTVRACVSDLAGNVAGPVGDSIDFDSTAPTGCALLLTGRRADGTDTSGATADVTALRDVGVSLTGCNETPTEIYLTENASVTCTAINSYQWQPLTASTQFTLSSVDLSKTVRGCVRDAANNTLSFTADAITLDTTPPTGVSVSINGGAAWFNRADWLATNSNRMTISGSATGAVEWAVAESATPTVFSAWTSSTTQSLVFSAGEGTRTVYALFRDAVGNVTPVGATDSIEVDTIAPSLGTVAITGSLADGTPSEANTVTNTVQLGITHSGGTGLYVGDGTLAACPTSGYASFTGASASITLPGSGQGTRTVRACISDAAGNTAGYSQDTITFDSAAPGSCALSLVGRRVDGTATSGATVDKTAQSLVGIALTSCTETPTEIYLLEAGAVSCSATSSLSWQGFTAGATNFTLTGGDGSKSVVGCVRDAARNVSTLVLDSITLDTTPPNGASVSLHGGATYFNRNAYVTAGNLNRMNVTGTASGAAEWAYAEGTSPSSFSAFTSPTTVPVTFSTGDGTKTVRALFRDDVGNTTPVESSDSIEVDTDAPVLSSVSVSGTLADGTVSTSLTTTNVVTMSLAQTGGTLVAIGNAGFTCPATLAGFSAFNGSTASATLTSATSTLTGSACVADAAGNTSVVRSATITLDGTAPSGCALTLVGRRTDGTSTAGTVPEKTALAAISASLSSCAEQPSDIYLFETTGALVCPAPGSAVWQTLSGGLSIATTISSGDGLKTMKACVRDAARNVSAVSFQDTITLDTTPPSGASVSLHGGLDYFNRAAFLAASSLNRMNVTGTATGASEWAFAESTTPTSWTAFSSPTVTPFTFSSGDGTKRVQALFRDDVGNTTTAESSDTIEVDTVAPTLTSLTLTGTLGDGSSSTAITITDQVTATVVQSGGVGFAYGDGTFTCPSNTTFTTFNGSVASVTLPGSGSPRTVKACVADAAGNISTVATDTIEYDALTASGCAISLTGRKFDGTPTSGSLVDLTALRDVGVSLSGCAETNVQVALTEAGSVTCTNSAALTWVPLVSNTTFQLSAGDGAKTVRGCIRDQALNVGTLATDGITLDTTPPDSASVTLLDTNGYITSFTTAARGSANDATEWAYATSATGPFVFSAFSDPTSRPVTFTGLDGTKTVYARFRDALLNTTTTVTDTVIVDTTPPTAPVLLTVDGQNRGARLFWDPSADTNGIARYELLSASSGTPSVVRNTVAGTATDGYVLGLENRIDQVFAVRAVDNAGNPSALSGVLSTTTGWERTTVSPGSVYPVRPLDVALKGSDVYVTYMETDTNWSGTGGTLWVAVSHDRGATWSFKPLDTNFGGGRQLAPIGFTDSAVWVATVANPGYASDITAGQVAVYSSTNRGDTWSPVSVTGLSSTSNYGKVDSLGLMTSGASMRLTYMLASSTATKQINLVGSDSSTSTATLTSDYDVTWVWGNAPYQVTNGLRSCNGNFSSLTMWRDRSSASQSSPNLRALTHYYVGDRTFDTSAGEGTTEWVTSGYGTGQEVGNYDLACTSLSETMQAYVVYDRSPAAAWAVGANGTILKYDDTAWVSAPSPTPRTINSVQDVWAVGAGYSASGTNYSLILRWNGSSWEEIKATEGNGATLFDSWTYTASNVYAVGTSNTVLRWDGSAWSAMTTPVSGSTLYGVWGMNTANIWAVGSSGNIIRYNGTSWATQTSGTANSLRAVWGTGTSSVWAVGDNGTILFYNGTSWTSQTSNTTAQLLSIWGTSSSNIWAVGSGGTIIRYNGSTWSVVASPTSQTLNEVSGVSASDIWAVGNNGTAIRYNGSTWSLATTETTQQLNSVWWGGSSGGPAASLYGKRKLGSLQMFGVAQPLRTDSDRNFGPQIWAGGRNVYVLYRATDEKLWLGESTDEGSTFANWTTLESGVNKGFYAVLAGDNSSDVAVAFTDVNAATFTVMIPAVPAFPLTPQAGVTTSAITWATVPGVDRYQMDSDPDGASPWANVDFTSLTQATVPTPPGLAPYVQVRAVDARNMPGNTGELWQLRPFGDVAVASTTGTTQYNSNTGGVVAYNDRAFIWPPRNTNINGEMQIFRSSNYGASWTSYTPFSATTSANGERALAGFWGKAVMLYEDFSAQGQLRAVLFPDIVNSTPNTYSLLYTQTSIDFIAAKTSVDQTYIVVAWADAANDVIRVGTFDTNLAFTYRGAINTTAANTIGTLEVLKADFVLGAAAGRIVIGWREYSTGDPRSDYIRMAESINSGVNFGAPFTEMSGSSSTTSQFADYSIGNTTLSGSNNGAYSVLARTTQADDFNNKPANLYLTVTGTDHSPTVSSATYVDLKLDSETVDTKTLDAFANSDGHYIAYRAETLDGTTVKLRFAYCFADCHLFQSWDRSLLKVWTSYVRDQGRYVNMTVAQTTSTAFDPAIYVLYQEAVGTTRNLKVLTRGVHRRTR